MGIFGGSPQDQVDLDHLEDRVTRLEAAVTALQAQLAAVGDAAVAASAAGVPGAPAAQPLWMDEVRSLKANGKVINAIKVYREHTGVGLKEAKDAVESMY